VFHLDGEVDADVSDGEVRRFGPGSVVLVEDTIGAGHVTRPVGDTDRATIFVALEDLPAAGQPDRAPSASAGPAAA
jgi:hypothetical protein